MDVLSLSAFPPLSTSENSRLFVGGLSDNTDTECVKRLLKPFGVVSHVDLNDRGFAHVTFSGTDESSIERCITALNRTMWRSNLLRIERAQEHYRLRLEREWRVDEGEDGNSTDEDEMENDIEKEQKDKIEKKEVKFTWNGKYIRFDENEDDWDITRSIEDDESEKDDEKIQQKEYSEKVKNEQTTGAKSSVKKAVASTMSLFGLSTTTSTPISTISTPALESENEDEKKIDIKAPVNKKRRTESKSDHGGAEKVTIDLDRARAVENDTRLIDLDLERRAALSVISAMFSGENEKNKRGSQQQTQESVRRPGLYRRLKDVMAEKRSSVNKEGVEKTVEKKKRKTSAKGLLRQKLKKQKQQKEQRSTKTKIMVANMPSPIYKDTLQRKGLYKRLLRDEDNDD